MNAVSGTKPKAAATYAFLYATMLPRIQEIAVEHGYCLALHGSMARDLDILCVPWVDDAKPAEALVAALAKAFSWFGEDGEHGVHGPQVMPHGRRAWTVSLGSRAFIDVSVMPLADKEPVP